MLARREESLMTGGFEKFCCLAICAAGLILNGYAQSSTPPKSKAPIAIVGGQSIFEEELIPMVQSQLLQLRNQEYTIKSSALERLIGQKLLEAEAKKKGLTTEKLLEQEVDAKVAQPTQAEIEAFYLGQKDKINQPFESIKAQLQQSLRQAKIQAARQEYSKRLRSEASVAISLRPPKVDVAFDSARLRGDAKAPVMIVEFSDYQCSYCRRAEESLKTVLAKYAGKVKLAYRDFPLRDMHPQAELAAEASRCAAEQGKYWEYHDSLYATAKLDKASLIEQAKKLGVDDKKFDACLSENKYKDQIEQDVQDGSRAGVSGTPAFFINGIFLQGAQPAAAFEKIIEEELAASK
jgi:protein-disulfide isomerase